MSSECCTELRVARHRCMPDPVNRAKRITYSDRVDPPPFPSREHPRIHLNVQVPVRIAGPGRVMPLPSTGGRSARSGGRVQAGESITCDAAGGRLTVDDPSREGRRHVLTDTATTAPVGVPARRRLGLRT